MRFGKNMMKKNNLIYHKEHDGYGTWKEFDENKNLIYFKDINENEDYYKYDDKKRSIKITKQEFEQIKRIKKEKEFNSRTKVSRFRLMDI